jgi:short-subunit dehydrogenase
MADIRLEMETHFFGILGVTRAFAPVLEANGGGAILNVLSVLSWVPSRNALAGLSGGADRLYPGFPVAI